jgi:hypothetical protein
MRARETDGFNIPRLVAMGQEVKRLMMEPVLMLPWPQNLFAQQAAMSQTLQQLKPRTDAQCICGKEHRQLWPRTVRSTYGHGFNVTYYCSNACKTRAAQQDSR